MVEDVEELGAETQSHFFSQMKFSLESNIGLPRAKTSQHVSSEISLLAGGREHKSRAVENFAAGELRPKYFKRLSRNQVRPRRERDASRRHVWTDHVDRGSGSGKDKTVHRPSAED